MPSTPLADDQEIAEQFTWDTWLQRAGLPEAVEDAVQGKFSSEVWANEMHQAAPICDRATDNGQYHEAMTALASKI